MDKIFDHKLVILTINRALKSLNNEINDHILVVLQIYFDSGPTRSIPIKSVFSNCHYCI